MSVSTSIAAYELEKLFERGEYFSTVGNFGHSVWSTTWTSSCNYVHEKLFRIRNKRTVKHVSGYIRPLVLQLFKYRIYKRKRNGTVMEISKRAFQWVLFSVDVIRALIYEIEKRFNFSRNSSPRNYTLCYSEIYYLICFKIILLITGHCI